MKKPTKFETAFETYVVQDVLGEGGNGVVYAATSSSDNQRVAIKCLRPERTGTRQIKRFQNEVSFCQRHSHNNVVRVLDSGHVDIDTKKCPFLVMQHFDGTMRDALAATPDRQTRLGLFSQVLDGVESAHLLQCWHRDLKPDNILWLKASNRVAVSDFGIAHFAEEDLETAVRTRDGERLANFEYAAPEQKDGSPVDHRADIFALGLLLNWMMTGKVPHGSSYAKIGDVDANLAWLDLIVDSMTHQDPGKRLETVTKVKESLIGRQLTFVQRQRLDAESRQVVPAGIADASETTPITIVGADWRADVLLLRLSRVPTSSWSHILRNAPWGYNGLTSGHPRNCTVAGDELRIPAREHEVRNIRQCYERNVKDASEWAAREAQTAARNAEAAQRRKLEENVAKEETRLRVLKSLEA